MLKFLIASLAVYRLSILITEDEGPYSIFQNLRKKAGGYELAANGEPETNLGRGIICPLCVGVWLSIPFALYLTGINTEFFIYWFAIAGLQTFLVRIS